MTIRVKITRQKVNGQSGAVISLDLEQYLRGVVPSEIPISSPPAALQAQAIAARTFAAKAIQRNRSKPFDVDDTTAYQAYRLNYSAPATDAAIQATSGIVLTYNGGLIDAVYSASNGGKTTSAKQRWGTAFAYLPEQADPYDQKAGYPKNGHGVGMSQRGAQQAARDGLNCAQILAFYYPGTLLLPIGGGAPQAPPAPSAPTQTAKAVYAVCSGSKVNVRRSGSTSSQVIGLAMAGDKMIATAPVDGWCGVAVYAGGKMICGFMAADYVKTI